MKATLINTSRNGVKSFIDTIPLPVLARLNSELSKKNNVQCLTIPEFGFCEVCQPMHALIAKVNPDYIDYHAKSLKPLWMGSCVDCLNLVVTDGVMCYVMKDGRITRNWMPMATRN